MYRVIQKSKKYKKKYEKLKLNKLKHYKIDALHYNVTTYILIFKINNFLVAHQIKMFYHHNND